MDSSMNSTSYFTIEGLQARVWDELPRLEADFGCTGGCPALFQEFMDHPTWECDAAPNLYPGGNWIGHIFPGTLFAIWASHWLLGFVRQYFECVKRGDLYRSRACYRLLWFPDNWPIEQSVKFFFPFVNILLEVWLAHKGGYRRLICPPGTVREGHMNADSLGNWQHAFMYPGFIVSGLVDLVSRRVEVPHGTSQLFLALGFVCEALLFGLHKKHTPMDVLVHELLTYSVLACAVFAVLEAAWQHNPLLTAGRIASMYLQAAWFFASAHVMYESHTAWSTIHDTDLAPVMYLPNLFAQLGLIIICGMLAAFVLGFVIYRPQPVQPDLVMEHSMAKYQGAGREGDEHMETFRLLG